MEITSPHQHNGRKWLLCALSCFALATAAGLSACRHAHSTLEAHGYVEGQLTNLASSIGGTLTQLIVKRGERVKPGQLLFQIDHEAVEADLQTAIADVKQAKAHLADLQKGKRPSEIEAQVARQNKVKAELVFAKKEVERYRALFKNNHVEKRQLDQSVKNLEALRAELDELNAELTTAKLPARTDAIEAAKAAWKASVARLRRARWQLKETRVTAPVEAYVYDTFYRLGEHVPPNRPVVSLIVPEDIKAVFFVGAPYLHTIHVGDKLEILCIHCAHPVEAKVLFISPYAEYTPPVIYSEESREKLVYRVEAAFKHPVTPQSPLHQGQPIIIRLSTQHSPPPPTPHKATKTPLTTQEQKKHVRHSD